MTLPRTGMRSGLWLAVLWLVLAGCGGSGPAAASSPSVSGGSGPSPSVSGGAGSPAAASATAAPASVAGPDVSLTVFAASSLKTAFTALGDAWDPHHAMRYSFDSSSALAAQIQQGAPADIFASADTKNPQAVATAGLTLGPPVPFAGNVLVIIVPSDNPAYLASPADLANPGVRIVAAVPDVPITTYANQAVANLGKLSGYPPGYAAAVAANVVSREDNVAAVVAKIALGEGDAAIVYATDARASDKVTTISIPAAANVSATYAAVALTSGSNQFFAKGFLEWLAGPVAQAILAEHGFLPPP